MSERKTMTTSAGAPISDNQNSMTAGERGPVLMQDWQLIEKLAHQNRERIPDRDVRGFALKFYTEEGNWDMVGNNTPVFFVRDPLKFPDFIYSQKRHPRANPPQSIRWVTRSGLRAA